MSLDSLRVVAAYHALGLASAGQMVDAAHDALNGSVYTYSLGELATVRHQRSADCEPLFVAALRELQIPMPNASEAVEIIVEYNAVRIVEGAASLSDILHDLYTTDMAFSASGSAESVQADESLRSFVGIYYAIDDYHSYRIYQEEQRLPQVDDDGLNQIYSELYALADQWCRTRWETVLDPSRFSADVLAIARGVLHDRAFYRLPILADAIQEAGCEDEFILDHLRKDGPHTRGCFVVDLLLNREPGETNRCNFVASFPPL